MESERESKAAAAREAAEALAWADGAKDSKKSKLLEVIGLRVKVICPIIFSLQHVLFVGRIRNKKELGRQTKKVHLVIYHFDQYNDYNFIYSVSAQLMAEEESALASIKTAPKTKKKGKDEFDLLNAALASAPKTKAQKVMETLLRIYF